MDVHFGPFSLDDRARILRRGRDQVHLSPKAFDLLTLLVRQRPAAISKGDIHQHLWPDTFVSEGNLAVLIGEIRDALGDSARQPEFVRTVQRFGYAFLGAVEPLDTGPGFTCDTASCWLTWGAQRAPLVSGENLIGRDPAARVSIEVVGVSRRHAMIVVASDHVTLHDLSSKNGTYVDDVRVTSPMTLTDGTEIRVGPAVVCFRRAAGMTSTQTLNTSRGSRARK